MCLINIYIAGPMRGVKDMNYEEFNKADEYLTKKRFYKTFNPARFDKESGLSGEYLESNEGLRVVMRRDLQDLMECHAIYMLNGWERSEGARIEHALAVMLRMTIIYQ